MKIKKDDKVYIHTATNPNGIVVGIFENSFGDIIFLVKQEDDTLRTWESKFVFKIKVK
jgi:hypothetical protein